MGVFWFFGLALASMARAQQAIVSLPSADITPEGQGFVMHETQARFWDPKPYWNTTHFITYGLDENIELAATLFNVGVPWPNQASVALGFKANSPLFAAEAREWNVTLTYGAMGLVSLVENHHGYWLYALGSVRLPTLRTRLAAGFSYGTRQLFGVDTPSFMASIEQPVPGTDEHLQVVAEWFSGDHDLANLIFGLTYHPDHTWIFVLGWKIPTASSAVWSQHKMGLVAEIGLFF